MASLAVATALAAAPVGHASAQPGAQPGDMIGGQCRYVQHPGTCTIDSMEKTPDSTAQASLGGGPGYAGFAVGFTYTGVQAGDDALVRQALEGRHELRLMNSWYPGPRFLERYGIAAGKSFACTLNVIAQGTCTPTVINFPQIDRADYFESDALSK